MRIILFFMKKIGLFIIVIGLAISVFAGISFITREKVIDIGSVEIMADKSHTLDWSPYLGFGVASIGLVVFLFGIKKK